MKKCPRADGPRGGLLFLYLYGSAETVKKPVQP